MRSYVQMSLSDTYENVAASISEKKPELISLLEQHIDFDGLIPARFKAAFYGRYGRSHKYHLESFIRALILQKLLGIPTDALLITILKCSRELSSFCGFDKIPDASQFTRFRDKYCDYLSDMFEYLVDLTEPICREIHEKKADYLIYDTTGIELSVKENNPKFLSTKLKAAKSLAKSNPDFDPYRGVYSLLPNCSETNPDIHQQHINGHFCYAAKVGIVTNGLGIIRHISFFDENFKNKHKDISFSKSDNPDSDKEIGDSTSLKPVLSDFFSVHPDFVFKTFIGDSAFDSYDNYSMLKNEFGFERACIPLNPRNSKSQNAEFDFHGTPVCPLDGKPFSYLGKSGGAHRSLRFKWVCPKSIANGNTRYCTCETPCTASSYGKCVYTYPDKDFRFYPGIPRNTEHWNNLYRHRVVIERTINLLKDTFVLDSRKSVRTVSAKADLYLAGIVQLIGVLLANSLCKPHFCCVLFLFDAAFFFFIFGCFVFAEKSPTFTIAYL